MSPEETFEVVRKEFGETVAVRAVAIVSVQLTQKTKLTDLQIPGNFTARLKRKARKLLWQCADAEFDTAFEVAMALYDYEARASLQGLGGCKAATLKEILKKQDCVT